MARMLFIETNLRNEKLGIMYLSAVLKENGHDTLLCCYERENIHEIVKSFSPDFLAFSLTTGAHHQLIEISTQLRKKYNLKVVFGGPHATFFAKDIPDNAVDFIVVGQGEKAIVDVVEERVKKKVLIYDFVDLDTIPFPDRSLFYRFKEFGNNPMKNVITSRDCPYSCSYCYNHSWKNMFKEQTYFLQRRNVDNVIEEIKELKRDCGVEKILFVDDNLLIDEKWVEEFCSKYKKELGLPFLCSLRVNLLDERKLKMLKDAGLFMVNFALESADPEAQKTVLNRGNITNRQVAKAISLMKKYNIKSRMQNMIGLPLKKSLKDSLNTLEFNRIHKVDDSWVSIAQPYPNTKLAEYAVQNGFIDGKTADSVAESFFDESYLKIDHREEIKRLQKWWYFIIKYNLSQKLVNIILEINFDDSIGESFQKLRFEFSRNYLYGIRDGNNGLLDYNWNKISSRFRQSANFNNWIAIIKKYKLCIGLSEILMSMNVPETLAKELREYS